MTIFHCSNIVIPSEKQYKLRLYRFRVNDVTLAYLNTHFKTAFALITFEAPRSIQAKQIKSIF